MGFSDQGRDIWDRSFFVSDMLLQIHAMNKRKINPEKENTQAQAIVYFKQNNSKLIGVIFST